jgi:uncharacterized membrane protein YbaN (DUF454 family)
MSNVIIGIIGVILFIGLAAAGATILGSDFMQASASTRAATVVAHLQQYSQAVNVLRVRRAITVQSSVGTNLGNVLVSNNALEEVPVNPIVPGSAYVAANRTGGSTGDIGTVFTDLGNSKMARDTCFEIETQAGNTNAAAVVDASTRYDERVIAAPRVGCMMNFYYGNNYMAYIVI